jgi:hypothetical protein
MMRMTYEFKGSKERMILLFYYNAEGDCKMKPLLIRVKGYMKLSLKSTRKATIKNG